MKTIWKHQLPITDRFEVMLPIGAQCLSVDVQSGVPCLWTEVDSTHPAMLRRFAIVGTGNPLPDEPKKYIGTFQMAGGRLVWHLFELTA